MNKDSKYYINRDFILDETLKAILLSGNNPGLKIDWSEFSAYWKEYKDSKQKARYDEDGRVIMPVDEQGKFTNIISMEGFMDWLYDKTHEGTK